MVTINTRVATTGGSQVRGTEIRLGSGPQGGQVAALSLLDRVGGGAQLQQLQQRFEFRLVSRNGDQFLQLREKTTFGALKAFFSEPARIRQEKERLDAQALLKMLGSGGQALAQQAHAGFKPIAPQSMSTTVPAPIFKAPAAPPPAAQVPVALPRVAPAPPAPAPLAPAPATPSSTTAVQVIRPPVQADQATALEPTQGSGVEKPLVIRKWEVVAEKMSPMDLVRNMDPWDLSDLLSKGEITQQTYQQALGRLKDQGRLEARDYAFHKNSLPAFMPDPTTVSTDKLRARFVREKVQVELFKDLPMKHVFGLGLSGEISGRAYQQIYKEQIRNGKLDEQGKVVWKTLDAPASAETKVQELDLSMQVLFRKMELHSISLYRDHSLVDLSEARRKGTISHIAYEAILESQKRRGLIDDTQFMLWKNG